MQCVGIQAFRWYAARILKGEFQIDADNLSRVYYVAVSGCG